MRLLFELFLFLGIFFPIYHVLNLINIPKLKKRPAINIHRAFTIIIPCYNEEKIVKNTIEGLLRINYPKYECIFINDGSSDNTLGFLNELLCLKKCTRKQRHILNSKNINSIYKSGSYPNIFVIDKPNGGKSDALNIGINYARYNYIVTMDADCVMKKNALAIINTAFNDPNVVAASGVIQILQSFNLTKLSDKPSLKINALLKLQTVEYIKACFCYKASLAKANSLLVISGAFGAFRKDILLVINGFNHVIGEDLDLTLRIQFKIFNTAEKIAYLPNAICYTEGPETFIDYMKQRKRWQKSFIECLINYRGIIFNNFFSKSLPFFMIIDALFIGVISSFVILTFLVLITANILNNNASYLLPYLLIFATVHLFYNIAGLLIAYNYKIRYKGLDILRIVYTVILDILIYRIIILYAIVTGTISYFFDKHTWNKVNRSGRDYNVLKRG
jgi:poly-beta-1,6-N-acetyl-D-glucosamine synthase